MASSALPLSSPFPGAVGCFPGGARATAPASGSRTRTCAGVGLAHAHRSGGGGGGSCPGGLRATVGFEAGCVVEERSGDGGGNSELGVGVPALLSEAGWEPARLLGRQQRLLQVTA